MFTAYALFRKYDDGKIVKFATVATLADAMAAQATMVGTGFQIVARPFEIDFDPNEASHLA